MCIKKNEELESNLDFGKPLYKRKKQISHWQVPYMTYLHISLTTPIIRAVIRTRIMAPKCQMLKYSDIS